LGKDDSPTLRVSKSIRNRKRGEEGDLGGMKGFALMVASTTLGSDEEAKDGATLRSDDGAKDGATLGSDDGAKDGATLGSDDGAKDWGRMIHLHFE
jgi:hypothetical protein